MRTKREKRPKTWSLRFDLLTVKMCIWDYKSSRLVLRCLCLASMNPEVVCGDDREIFVMIIEGLILLQLWNKIVESWRWPPSFKSIQITSSFLSLYSHLRHKTLKNVPASGWVALTTTLGEIGFGRLRWIFQVMAHNCLWPFCSPSLLYMVCRHACILTTVIVLPKSSPVLSNFLAVFWWEFF